MMIGICKSQLLRRLRQENCFNPGGGGCSELRSCHYTPAWGTKAKLCLKKIKIKNYEHTFEFYFLSQELSTGPRTQTLYFLDLFMR